jgi:hypothetical protein
MEQEQTPHMFKVPRPLMPKVEPHKLSHAEQLVFWQGRLTALCDVDGHYERVDRLMIEAERELAKLRELEGIRLPSLRDQYGS